MNSTFEKLKVQKSLLWLVKFLVFVFVLYQLVKRLQKISLDDFSSLAIVKPIYIIIAMTLVFVNWGIEALKWYLTIRKIGFKTSNGRIVQSLLSGISTGLITPNRIGNFIGRMLYFKPKKRALVVLGTLYGNLAQFIATVFFGMIGLYFIKNNSIQFEYSDTLIVLSIFLTTLAVLIYFSYPFIWLTNIPILRSKANIIQLFRQSAKRLVIPLLILSGCRYLVFILQFALLLIGFGAMFSHELIYSLFVLYLVSTLTPTLILGKLVVRETLAVLILGTIIFNPLIILAASFSLWLINLGFPAVVGLYFFFKSKTPEE
jgi:uncharacterized membrane protein YbhN (UPF0104 family)